MGLKRQTSSAIKLQQGTTQVRYMSNQVQTNNCKNSSLGALDSPDVCSCLPFLLHTRPQRSVLITDRCCIASFDLTCLSFWGWKRAPSSQKHLSHTFFVPQGHPAHWCYPKFRDSHFYLLCLFRKTAKLTRQLVLLTWVFMLQHINQVTCQSKGQSLVHINICTSACVCSVIWTMHVCVFLALMRFLSFKLYLERS